MVTKAMVQGISGVLFCVHLAIEHGKTKELESVGWHSVRNRLGAHAKARGPGF